MKIQPTYKIGEQVIHVCSNQCPGVVVDWRYYGSGKKYEYQVTFSHTDRPIWFFETELKPSK